MTHKTSKRPGRSLSTQDLSRIQGGGRHAERSAADTAVSVSWCDSYSFNVPLIGGTITVTTCADGSGGATYTPSGGGGGDGGPHIA